MHTQLFVHHHHLHLDLIYISVSVSVVIMLLSSSYCVHLFSLFGCLAYKFSHTKGVLGGIVLS